MRCREFGAISESYLSKELLVETNLEILRHLENCQNLRKKFGGRRALLRHLRWAVRNTDDFQIDQIFQRNLSKILKKNGIVNLPG